MRPVLGIIPGRRAASWVDRLGRAVGWGRIVATAVKAAIVHLA